MQFFILVASCTPNVCKHVYTWDFCTTPYQGVFKKSKALFLGDFCTTPYQGVFKKSKALFLGVSLKVCSHLAKKVEVGHSKVDILFILIYAL